MVVFFKATSDEYSFDKVTEKVGEPFEILRTNFKPYACCKSVHAPLEATLTLREQYHLEPEQVDKITVKVNKMSLKMAGSIFEPTTTIAAQMSIPYGVALGLLEGTAAPENYNMDKIQDANVAALIKKIEVISDTRLDELRQVQNKVTSIVEIRMKDGKRYECFVEDVKGMPENPLTYEEMTAKFHNLASKGCSSGKIQEMIHVIEHLEQLEDVNDLCKLLQVAS